MKKYKLPNIPEKEQTPRIKSLLLLLEKAYVHQQEQEGKITCLKNEIAILKGEKSGLSSKEVSWIKIKMAIIKANCRFWVVTLTS